jgi:hypothetical protein
VLATMVELIPLRFSGETTPTTTTVVACGLMTNFTSRSSRIATVESLMSRAVEDAAKAKEPAQVKDKVAGKLTATAPTTLPVSVSPATPLASVAATAKSTATVTLALVSPTLATLNKAVSNLSRHRDRSINSKLGRTSVLASRNKECARRSSTALRPARQPTWQRM